MLLTRRAALAALFALSSAGALRAQANAPALSAAPPRPAVVPAATPMVPARPVVVRPNGERWAQITAAAANARATRFPIGRGHVGPAVLRVQTLLDRALFSPGMIDGRWGHNTEVALRWLQVREGLPATGAVDSATMARLEALAGMPDTVVHRRALRPEDVRGPFTPIPADIYAQAKLSCSCYESLTERLTEIFHTSAGLLRHLNPGIKLDSLRAGDSIHVPLVRPMDVPAPAPIAELWVSGSGRFVHAMSAEGRILYHFPTTLGATFDPSPQGDFSIGAITENPWWHYQPRILAHVPDDRPDARIPPGPNNAVGRVWMSLSVPHYGIHGTKSPETIGYATSAGCVRLTNWDALFLSRRVTPGTPVRFRGTRPGEAHPPAATAPDTTARPGGVPPARDTTARRDSVPPSPPRDTTARRDSQPPTPRVTTPPVPPR
jgi:hypothetical protein